AQTIVLGPTILELHSMEVIHVMMHQSPAGTRTYHAATLPGPLQLGRLCLLLQMTAVIPEHMNVWKPLTLEEVNPSAFLSTPFRL
ncbi:unnamed protein product, partial [Chrysoparadoxa australica]